MKHQILGGLIAATAITATAFCAGGTAVYVNGTMASSRVKVINGTAYVPLADMAKAYSVQVNKRSDGDFDLGAAGGAYQVGKYQGKIGQEVFTGQYKFSVVSVEEVKSYTTKYRASQETLATENPGQKIVVVACRIKNGTPTTQKLLMTVGGNYGSPNTALTTADEQSFPPSTWHGSSEAGIDVHEDDRAPVGAIILPGAARLVNLLFMIPTDAKPKDLVFSLTPYDEYAKGDKKKFTDVRIALNP